MLTELIAVILRVDEKVIAVASEITGNPVAKTSDPRNRPPSVKRLFERKVFFNRQFPVIAKRSVR